MPTGDKVIFPLTNQRVDKQDLLDMSVLVQETISRTIASLLGEGGGALTAVPFTWSIGADTITFGPCMLAYSLPKAGDTSNNLLEGGVVIHDPQRPAQNGLSSVQLGGASLGYFWFKRGTSDVDVDNRAYWPAPGSGEQVMPVATRNREHVEFTFTILRDDPVVNSANGWVRFATFRRIAATINTPITVAVTPISAFGDDRGEGEIATSLMGSISEQTTPGGLTAPYPGSTPATRKWGINRVVQDVISSILQVKDSQVTFDPTTRAITANPNNTTWRDSPAVGLRQIYGIVQNFIETQNAITSNVLGRLTATPTVLGFVYARPKDYPGTNIEYEFVVNDSAASSLLTPISGVPSRYPGLPVFGSATIRPFSIEVDRFLVQAGGTVKPIFDIKFSIGTGTVIDHIEVSSSMRQDWSGTPDDQVIDSDTRTRSAVISQIRFPKSVASIPEERDYPPNSTLTPPVAGQFVMRVKVANPQEDVRQEVEPFTLVVYGRNNFTYEQMGVSPAGLPVPTAVLDMANFTTPYDEDPTT
jgi:hypothetical protein